MTEAGPVTVLVANAAGPMQDGSHKQYVSMSFDFTADVIERSHKVPVLVDFWAPWCGPCRVLGPTLDKLEAESAGRWELRKVNTDQSPEIAQRFGVRGIPSVKLFVDGAVIKEFTGALGEAQVRSWLQEALPSKEDAMIQEAEAAVARGDYAAAGPLLETVLAHAPLHARARLRLAQISAVSDLSTSARLVRDLSVPFELKPVLDAVMTLIQTRSTPELPPGPGRAHYQETLHAIGRGDFASALQSILSVLQTDRFYMDDGARKLGVAIFTILGPTHELTNRFRRTFDMWLY